jgi:hypothetical protein
VALLALVINERNWSAATWISAALLVYLFGIRWTRCRVETLKHRPCRWRVRGYLRCCEFHRGLKRSPPALYFAQRWLIPDLMWPRHDRALDGPEPQPSRSARGYEAIAPRDRNWSAPEKVTTLIALVGLAVAIMSFIRDLVAG